MRSQTAGQAGECGQAFLPSLFPLIFLNMDGRPDICLKERHTSTTHAHNCGACGGRSQGEMKCSGKKRTYTVNLPFFFVEPKKNDGVLWACAYLAQVKASLEGGGRIECPWVCACCEVRLEQLIDRLIEWKKRMEKQMAKRGQMGIRERSCACVRVCVDVYV